jgi:membrane protein DedA with SNARE-associated domain
MRHGAKVVFFGRFVSILRTYAAFLAGTNHMRWRTFLVFNALGGIVWVSLYGTAAYLLGGAIDRLSRPLDIGLGVAGAVAVVAGIVVLRRRLRRLEAAAERALPGPLEHHLARPPR